MGQQQEIKVGAPTVSVRMIDAVEAYRPQPALKAPDPEITPPKPEIKPRPAPKPKPVEAVATPQPMEKLLEKTAQDEMESLASLATPVQAPTEAEPISVASFNADYLHNPKPPYPALSRRLREQGRVLLRVQVSTAGTPLEVTIKESSGFKRLDQAALETVKQWRFTPAKQGNTPLESGVDVPLQFFLEK